MNKLLVLICCLMLLPIEGFACVKLAPAWQQPKPWMQLSSDGMFLLKMIPAQWKTVNEKPVITRKPYTIAYTLENNGYLKQIWSMREVYRDPFLTSNGRNLLVIQSISSPDDIALIIYRDGKKVKTFKPADFGVTTATLRKLPPPACESVTWIHFKANSFNFYLDTLFIRTSAGKAFLLDINTGKVTPE